MYDVITIGGATRDIFVKSTAFEVHEGDHGLEGCFPLGAKIEIDELIFETGGGATNAAVTFGRLGHKVATVTAIGDDDGGKRIMAVLEAEKVAVDLVQVNPELQTGTSIIAVAGTGERTVLVYRGASQAVDPKSIPWDKLKATWFYVSSLGGNLDLMGATVTHAASNKTSVAWNPGGKELHGDADMVRQIVRQVDILNLNKEEAALLAGKDPSDLKGIIDSLRALPRRALIVTDGQNGAYAATRNEAWHSATIDVPRVNVTGAGDAFGSGLIAGLIKTGDLRYALACGTWNATGVVQDMGAKRGLLRQYPSDQTASKVAIRPWN